VCRWESRSSVQLAFVLPVQLSMRALELQEVSAGCRSR
jgi:hypothetical protein